MTLTKTQIEEKISILEDEIASLRSACTEPDLPKMIKIPDRSYSLGETPVTVVQYRDFCEATGRKFPKQPSPQHDDNPVTNVTWHDAQAYCAWISEKTGDNYRLPTEDEFEHFCGDHTEGDEEIAVYNQSEICQVKTKKPNKFGLYDCLGLIWEWMENSYE